MCSLTWKRWTLLDPYQIFSCTFIRFCGKFESLYVRFLCFDKL